LNEGRQGMMNYRVLVCVVFLTFVSESEPAQCAAGNDLFRFPDADPQPAH
jgi:hypothetical protein